MTRLSAVMSIYSGDNPPAISTAIDSIINQSRQPDEFIIVIDGPVGDDIRKCIDACQSCMFVQIHTLEKNVGRGPARNHAIAQATGDYVAIMDADDISRSNRFEIQLAFMSTHDLDLAGGLIEEFDYKPGDRGDIRRVPLNEDGISSMVKLRSPFNHVTVMFRRSFFERINGYGPLNFVEDWDLYFRSLYAGGHVANMPDILVDVRRAPWRRRNFAYFCEEIRVLASAYWRGQICIGMFLLSCSFRIIKLIIPKFLFFTFFRLILRHR